MALFPAYAHDSVDSVEDVEESTTGEEWLVPVTLENQLLASDEEQVAPHSPPAKRSRTVSPADDEHFYLDTRIDYGNLRVSTLYYPGRPEYHAEKPARALGGEGRGAERRARGRRRRYWQGGAEPLVALSAEVSARRAAIKHMLTDAPTDEDLWLRYIRFQEEWGAEGAALEAAREAVTRVDTARVRAALHRARARALTPAELRAALRDDIAAESRAGVRRELWARLLEALGAEGAREGATAALHHLAADPAAYPHLIYVYGCILRAAGLWEQVVQLVELAVAMNFPAAACFPPAASSEPRDDAEGTAQRLEDAACRSGLPLSAVWARVERLRAAAHWRPSRTAHEADPQRAPEAALTAELVRPTRGERCAAALCVALLRVGKVPLLPSTEHVARCAGAECGAGEAATAEALAALLRAARRLPAAHPARPVDAARARAALAPLLDPPHYFSDAAGYLSWMNALWEACCEWNAGWRRDALLCWRLRWLHALGLLADPGEARRLRAEARHALKRHAPRNPLAFAHFARLETLASGNAAGARAAVHALRAALRDCDAPPEHALFAARVVADLAPVDAAAWALCCAALRRPLPPDADLETAPPRELVEAARDTCELRCEAIERQFEASAGARASTRDEEEEVCAAMLPGAGEWAAARVALASPPDRVRLLARLLAARDVYRSGCGVQYYEQMGVALVLRSHGAARLSAARALLPLFPRNALLALVCGGAPLWTGGEAEAEGAASSARAALALVVPRLLRAPLHEGTDPLEAGRLAAACTRLARRGAGGALLATLRLEAAARARTGSVPHALLAAIDAHPDH